MTMRVRFKSPSEGVVSLLSGFIIQGREKNTPQGNWFWHHRSLVFDTFAGCTNCFLSAGLNVHQEDQVCIGGENGCSSGRIEKPGAIPYWAPLQSSLDKKTIEEKRDPEQNGML